MPHAKQASKRRHRSKAAPVLGAAGLSLSIAGGASATTGGAAVQMPTPQNLVPSHHIMLGEEEMSDVSLGTFYVFDKEHGGTLDPNIQLAAGGCGCGHGGGGCGHGCGGCGFGCRGCGCGFGGCGGCWGWGWGWGGCCLSWGGCALC